MAIPHVRMFNQTESSFVDLSAYKSLRFNWISMFELNMHQNNLVWYKFISMLSKYVECNDINGIYFYVYSATAVLF
jgi:hypothetical protein